MILGVDVSTYFEELAHGARFTDGGRVIDPLDALRENGVEWMRIRLWHDPYSEDGAPYLAGGCDMDGYIRMACLAREKGYSILLDIHYSDFWADPGKQMIPKAWRGMTLPEMADAVYEYTREVLLRTVREGVAPDMIQIGNEITNGILWPIGRLTEPSEKGGERGNYDSLILLLKSGIRAAREVLPGAELVLHLERSNDAAVYQEFFGKMAEAEVDYDVIGASYYPYWHGTPAEMLANLDACRRFGKRIMIVEMGYGFTTEAYSQGGEKKRLVIDVERAYVEGVTDRYPLTPEGQAEYVRDLLSLARAHGIHGVFYWEPLWLPGEGICWASPEGQEYIGEAGKSTANEWANQCLFDYEGEKLPAFDEFRA